MIKRLLAAAGSLLVLAAAVSAGGDYLEGSNCRNACPLAQRANTRFATGHEAVAVSKTVRAEFVRVVLENLENI